MSKRGLWGMSCWNALSEEQRQMLLLGGVLPFGRKVPEGGTCEGPAEVGIETLWDTTPGPRFYCRSCALEFLSYVGSEVHDGVE